MKESYEDKIAPVVAMKWAERQDRQGASVPKKEPKAGFRAEIAREVFAALPMTEQKEIASRAKSIAASAKAAYLKGIRDPPSTSPAARQE
jgi:hypothetical protein